MGAAQQQSQVVGYILAGYDSVYTNQFKVSSFESSSGFQVREIVIPTFIAAQFHVAYYLSGKLFYPEMMVEQLKELAVLLMLETMSTEITVGGPIQLATVTLRNGFQRITDDEIQELTRNCQPKVQAIRKLLLSLWDQPNFPLNAIKRSTPDWIPIANRRRLLIRASFALFNIGFHIGSPPEQKILGHRVPATS